MSKKTKPATRQKKPKKTTKSKHNARKNQDLVITFDLGGTKLASAVVHKSGKVLAEHRELVDFANGPKGFFEQLTRRARAWKEQFPEVEALGIASCGPLDPLTGELLQPTNFPKWGKLPLRSALEKSLRMPVIVQNDAAAAAQAEGWLGGAKKMNNWVVLTLGTGLGTGIILGRVPFMGGSGYGPEAGHMIVTDKAYACGCGNQGCAESVVSGSGLKRRIVERKLPYADTRSIVQGARDGHVDAISVFDEFSEILARVIHNISVMYKPECIFFAGGVAEAQDLFLGSAESRARVMLAGRTGFMPKLKVSDLGHRLGMLGGAYVAHKYLKNI